jgi:D-alanyl-D-alanine carboxypeptidase/D-alanyl-D-alanine-endopeptidase (penicillin-binding protein 4)
VDHQFETAVYGTGPIEDGVLKGNLYVKGGGDALFGWQEGFALGRQLEQLGLRRVTGNLIVSGPFWMNFSLNSRTSAQNLKTALNRRLWSPTLKRNFPKEVAPQIQIDGAIQVGTLTLPEATPLVMVPSLPLWKIAKRMNKYSTNQMADMLGAMSGGAVGMEQHLQNTFGLDTRELNLRTASGLGHDNRFSPETITKILAALEARMQSAGLQLSDVLAVKGTDPGTLWRRGMPQGVIAKTGTLNGVSCLAGVIDTRDHGPLRFVLLNQGAVKTLRHLQDWFLQAVQARYGKPSLGASASVQPSLLPIAPLPDPTPLTPDSETEDTETR